MNVLTKAFVVLVAVMSVILMALVVSFAANTENYRQLAQSSQEKTKTAEAKTRAAQNQITAAQNARSEEFAAQANQIAELTASQAQHLSEIADLKTKLVTANADLVMAKSDLSTLANAGEQNAQLLQLVLAEVQERRTMAATNEKQIIELTDRNNQLQSERDSLERGVNRYTQQIVALNETIKDLEEKLVAGPAQAVAGAEPRVAPERPIVGQIVRLKKDGEATFAELNVGSKDGVKEKMEFLVHRGDTFLGKLTIDAVDVNAAAGSIVMTVPGAKIAAKDGVYAGP